MSIISDVKEIADVIKKLDDIELYRKIIELEGQINELTRENRALEEQVKELQRQADVIEKLKWKNPFYFMEGDKTPYCARCIEAEKKPVHVHPKETLAAGERPWVCPKCKTQYFPSLSDKNPWC